MIEIATLDVGQNQLSGTVPAEYARLTKLNYLCVLSAVCRVRLSYICCSRIDSNMLSGSLPVALVQLLNTMHPLACYIDQNCLTVSVCGAVCMRDESV
jgi:hypothetical protein